MILQTPENGILPEGTSGSIRLSTSIVGTEYWVTRASALFTSEISGTGSMLDLGNYYPSGSYDVNSRTQHNCSLVQGTVNFTTGTGGNTGAGKIVANVSFGTPASSFPANHVNVKLYKKEIDINNNADIDEIIGVSVTNEEGQYYFEDVPVNANIQAFVTSFAHQNWTAFEIETDSYQTYNVNFIVSGTSVYPDYTTMIEDVQIQNIEFSVFPNPANDVLNINCDIEKAIVQIFDISGKLVKTELAFSNSEINISELVSGTYLIILSAENGKTGIQKFVKE